MMTVFDSAAKPPVLNSGESAKNGVDSGNHGK
jgi:hypothetical protein